MNSDPYSQQHSQLLYAFANAFLLFKLKKKGKNTLRLGRGQWGQSSCGGSVAIE